MEFVEVMKLRKKMCALTFCKDCKINQINNKKGMDCMSFMIGYPVDIEKILISWAKEHQGRTRVDIFKEQYPNCHYASVLTLCPNYFDVTVPCNKKCEEHKEKYWNEVVEEGAEHE